MCIQAAGGRLRVANRGVFLVTTKNAFVPIECVYSVNTYSRSSIVSQGSEQAHEQSTLGKQAEGSEQSVAVRCGAKRSAAEQVSEVNDQSE